MKAGNVTTQLAGLRIASSQANRFLLYLLTWLLPHTAAYSTKLDPLAQTAVPFKMLGNSIFVDGTLNSVSGWYLFDIGSPFVILNSAYFDSFSTNHSSGSLKSVHGEILNAHPVWLDNGRIGKLTLLPSNAFLLDLTAMERIKKIPIKGIIGYDAIRDMEIRFDFDCQDLIFSRGTTSDPTAMPTDSLEFKMSGHIPYIQVQLAGKSYKMGIDSGSEFNLFHKNSIKEQLFRQNGYLRLAGLTEHTARHPIGFIQGFEIADFTPDSLEVILVDLNKVANDLPTRLHGLLGVSFLKQHNISINYQRKKLYFWRMKTWPLLGFPIFCCI